MEKDPNGKAPNEMGAKLDYGKTPLWEGLIEYFPRACIAVADVSFFGAQKYAWKSWEQVPNGIKRYASALLRHLFKEPIEGLLDPDSKLLHAQHAAWNAMARLELILRERDGTQGR